MILGIGTDLVNIDRIAAVLARRGDRFRNRVFTPREQALARGRRVEAPTLARRWAAKEACAKALGTGLGQGIGWREIEVLGDALGAPQLVLTGRAAQRLAALAPSGFWGRAHLSLADDPPFALAFVVLEAVLAQGSDARF